MRLELILDQVKEIGLNPCCNGIYSMSTKKGFTYRSSVCLNPCCNGIYSMSTKKASIYKNEIVLILVVMEYTQ